MLLSKVRTEERLPHLLLVTLEYIKLKDHSVRIEWSLLTLTFLCYYSRYESYGGPFLQDSFLT